MGTYQDPFISTRRLGSAAPVSCSRRARMTTFGNTIRECVFPHFVSSFSSFSSPFSPVSASRSVFASLSLSFFFASFTSLFASSPIETPASRTSHETSSATQIGRVLAFESLQTLPTFHSRAPPFTHRILISKHEPLDVLRHLLQFVFFRKRAVALSPPRRPRPNPDWLRKQTDHR